MNQKMSSGTLCTHANSCKFRTRLHSKSGPDRSHSTAPRRFEETFIAALKLDRKQLLACLALALTLLFLLLPGDTLEALTSGLRQWWPWSTPGLGSGARNADKLIHFGLFALCGALVARAWLLKVGGWLPLYLSLLAFGVLTELLQYPIPGRNADFWDLVADGLGVALGLGGASAWQGRGRERPDVP